MGPYADAVVKSRAAVREMLEREGVSGVGVAVAADGEVVWAEGFGLAGLERRVPVTRETKVRHRQRHQVFDDGAARAARSFIGQKNGPGARVAPN